MKYIVVHPFKDLQDNEHVYRIIGDPYLREGKNIEEIPKERIEALATDKNDIGKILIKAIQETEVVSTLEDEEAIGETNIVEKVEKTEIHSKRATKK